VEGPFPQDFSVLCTLSRHRAAFEACGKPVHNTRSPTWKTNAFISTGCSQNFSKHLPLLMVFPIMPERANKEQTKVAARRGLPESNPFSQA
jgi:hypothetical protein